MATLDCSDQQRCLVEILTCLLCSKRVCDAHICPNCSKFYCLSCIRGWLQDSQKCFYCEKYLNDSMLVNCQKLCDDLSFTLDRIKIKQHITKYNEGQKNQKNCPQHLLNLTYYCKTCRVPLCSDCSVLSQQHRGHEFVKYQQFRNEYTEKASSLLALLAQAKQETTNCIKEHENRKEKEKQTSLAHLQAVESCMNNLREEITKSISRPIQQSKNACILEAHRVAVAEQFYTDHLKKLRETPVVQFIRTDSKEIKEELKKQLESISSQCQKMESLTQRIAVLSTSESMLLPTLKSVKFLIKNYSHVRATQKFFYTQKVGIDGLYWRLKIYPNGNCQANEDSSRSSRPIRKQDYLSIFIELAGGNVAESGTTMQRHRIELINLLDSSKRISREFESQFEVGECWGYDQYSKINTIYEEGYVHPEHDNLEIILSIGPSTYYEAAIIQEQIIKEKERLKLLNAEQIKRIMDILEHNEASPSKSVKSVRYEATEIQVSKYRSSITLEKSRRSQRFLEQV